VETVGYQNKVGITNSFEYGIGRLVRLLLIVVASVFWSRRMMVWSALKAVPVGQSSSTVVERVFVLFPSTGSDSRWVDGLVGGAWVGFLAAAGWGQL
jgi:hypothetical protein